jgi:hypothetical protein
MIIRYWSQIKCNTCIDNIHNIIPPDTSSLPLQILRETLNLEH